MSVNIAKVGVASSSLVSRSKFKKALIERWGLFYSFLNLTQISILTLTIKNAELRHRANEVCLKIEHPSL